MAQQLKCGCVFDGKSFVKYCREHGLMVARKRAEKYNFPGLTPSNSAKETK